MSLKRRWLVEFSRLLVDLRLEYARYVLDIFRLSSPVVFERGMEVVGLLRYWLRMEDNWEISTKGASTRKSEGAGGFQGGWWDRTDGEGRCGIPNNLTAEERDPTKLRIVWRG